MKLKYAKIFVMMLVFIISLTGGSFLSTGDSDLLAAKQHQAQIISEDFETQNLSGSANNKLISMAPLSGGRP